MIGTYINGLLQEYLGFEPSEGQTLLMEDLGEFLSAPSAASMILVKGYAGTGKTTVVKSLVHSLRELKQPCVLLAPTGRAAKVMSAYSGHAAWTIHKKIYRQRSGRDGLGEFVLDRNLHKHTCFIVDEASMIGDRIEGSGFGSGDLLADLMAYVDAGQNCRLILLGDSAQLPPVGLSISPALDPARLGAFGLEVRGHELTEVLRQSLDSGILANATRIRKLITSEKSEFPTFDLDNYQDIRAIDGEEFLEELSAAYDRDGPQETMVITRSNKRANLLNSGIRSRLLWREEEPGPGDLLMVVRNNYYWKDQEGKLDFIANGDIIEVIRILGTEVEHGHHFATALVSLPDQEGMEIEVKLLLDVLEKEGPSLAYEEQRELYLSVSEDYPEISSKKKLREKIALDPFYNALQVKYAYAVTCHKAQGGQWKNVFIDQGYFTEEMLDLDYLRWLYTAYTRAMKKLFLVNPPRAFIPR